MVAPITLQFLPLCLLCLGIAAYFGGSLLWFVAGGMSGLALAMFLLVWWRPSNAVLNWGIGAEGERRTAKALAPLVRDGWGVDHDLQRSHGNIDHLVRGPAGVFLIETKNLRGQASIENGVLTVRSIDDEDNVYAWRNLSRWLAAKAVEAAQDIAAREGERPWVQPVVVLWGEFAERVAEADRVFYVHGDELEQWLRSWPAARRRIELAN
jgi:hypothetical protein